MSNNGNGSRNGRQSVMQSFFTSFIRSIAYSFGRAIVSIFTGRRR